MSYLKSTYRSVSLYSPQSDVPAQVGVEDYANSQLVTLTGSSQSAAALPAGCHFARIANLGSNPVHIRGDDVAATTAAPALPAGTSDSFVCTAATRVFRLLGTASDTVTITPYLVADDGVNA